MKLLFCPKCWDVIKLAVDETRRCQCGEVIGRYVDNKFAETNGKGVCLALNNYSLPVNPSRVTKRIEIEAWAHPHEGELNPHTRINKDLT